MMRKVIAISLAISIMASTFLPAFADDDLVIAIQHEHDNTVVASTEPGCETDGSIQYTCSCGLDYTEIIPATGHSYSVVTSVEPGCETDGSVQYACECGAEYTEVIPATGHSYSVVSSVEPGPESEGMVQYACACGAEYTEIIPVTNHVHSVASSAEPGCETDGFIQYACECGSEYTEVIPATGHSYSVVTSVEPGCETDGSVQYACACGAEYTEAVPATGHSYTSTVITPSCTEPGYTAYVCICGDNYTDTITDPAGHVFAEGICTVCGEADPEYVIPELDPTLPQTAEALAAAFGFADVASLAEAIEIPEEELIAMSAEEIADLYQLILEMRSGMEQYADSEFVFNSYGVLVDYTGSATEVVIPDTLGITKIGYAFEDNTNITSVVIPQGVTSLTGTFKGCTSLKSVTLPSGLQDIGIYTFYECSNLSEISIPSTVNNIGQNAFEGCASIKSVTIPGFAKIGYEAFCGCTALESVIITDNEMSVRETQIIDNAFYGCTALKSVSIPGNVSSIGNYAFYNCTSLASLTIANGVQTIGNYAFEYCGMLKNVSIPSSISSIGNAAFSYCYSLESISIPDSVKTLGYSAFFDCSALSSVTLGNGLSSIGSSVFEGCSLLKGISIPSSITSISSGAFRGCSSITSITIPSSVTTIGHSIFYGCTSLTDVVIPNSIKTIGAATFQDCSQLGSITIPSSVTRIDTGAFKNCTALIDVIIPEGVTTLGNQVFDGCSALRSVVIPRSVTLLANIGTNIFANCPNVKAKVYANSAGRNYCKNNTIAYEVLDAFVVENHVLTKYQGDDSVVVIPSDLNITKIGAQAFKNNLTITSVSIPDGVKEIGEAAFDMCSNLASISLPNSLEVLGDLCFYNCAIQSITLPAGITKIPDHAFHSCWYLKEINLDNITEIGEFAFQATGFTELQLPEGLVTLKRHAFYICNSLKSVVIPESLTKISSWTFQGCDVLANVTLHDKLTVIGEYAFNACPKLASITLPRSLTNIENNAFTNCNALTAKVYYGTEGHNYCKNDKIRYNYAESVITTENWEFEDRVLTITGTATSLPNDIAYTSIVVNAGAELTLSSGVSVGVPVTNNGSISGGVFSGAVTNNGTITSAKFVGGASISGSGSTTVLHNLNGVETALTYGAAMPALEGNSKWFIGENEVAADATVPLVYTAFEKINPDFTVVDGVLTAYKGTDAEVVIPGDLGITRIGGYVFEDKDFITSVVIPDGVTAIEHSAFKSCSNLVDVTWPATLTVIGDYAFYSCEKITELTLPGNLVEIGTRAFYRLNGLTELHIPDGVTTIKDYAFQFCDALEIITVPDSVITVGLSAFDSDRIITCNLNTAGKVLAQSVGSKLVSPNAKDYRVEIRGSGDNATVTIIKYTGSATDITIPGTIDTLPVRIIYNAAFSGINTLVNVNLSEGLTTIGANAFRNCSSLESITIPQSITSIDITTFSGCNKLKAKVYYGTKGHTLCKEKNIPYEFADSVITAENWEFEDGVLTITGTATSLPDDIVYTSIIVNEGAVLNLAADASVAAPVTNNGTISGGLFVKPTTNNGTITGGEFDSSVTNNGSITGAKFLDGGSLDGTLSAKVLHSVNGVDTLLTYGAIALDELPKLSNGCKWYSGGYEISESYPIPLEYSVFTKEHPDFSVVDGVLSEYKGTASEVVIPGDLDITKIGDYAFAYCNSLTSVSIPEGVTSIGNSAFFYCDSLTSVSILEGVTSIGNSTFSNCSSLTSIIIPKGVTSIGDSAFSSCSSLTSVSIPEGVTSIGDTAFAYCSKLKTVTLPDSLSVVGENIVNYSTKLLCRLDTLGKLLVQKGYSNYYSVSAPDYKVDIHFEEDEPAWLEITDYHGDSAEINIPASIDNLPVLKIGNSAFDFCDSLTSVSIPEGVISIGNSAFYYCDSLTSVSIPEGVTSISNSAFEYCRSLTSVSIPKGVTSIGDSAFDGCSSLESVNIPEGVISIGNSAFEYCRSLTSISIPEGVTSIGDSAFDGCTLESIVLPDSLTSVGNNIATYTKLICSDLNTIGLLLAKAEGNDRIASVSVPDYAVKIHLETDDIVWLEITAYTGAATEITTPASIDSLPVMKIGDSAFSGCDSLTSVTIPEGVTSIGDDAFYNCDSLTSVSIPEGVTSIGDYAFAFCYLLTSVSIPEGVTSIGNHAFYSCDVLENITLPDSLSVVGENIVSHNTKLLCRLDTAGKVLAKKGYIDYHSVSALDFEITIVFAEDDSAWLRIDGYTGTDTEIIIPGSVDNLPVLEIGYVAFRYNDAITSVTISENIKTIGEYAFEGCWSLQSLYLPDSLTTVGDYFIRNSYNVKLYGSLDTVGKLLSQRWRKVYSISAPEYGVVVYDDDEGTWLRIVDYRGTDAELSIPASIEDIPVLEIGSSVFEGCTFLTSVSIPEGVTSIGDKAFYGCSTLTSVSIPEGVTSIGNSAFEDCSSLTNVTIPESVTSIGNYAFRGCTALTNVTIQEGVTSIGDSAFSGCSTLTNVTIPESVTSIGSAAFFGCTALTSVTISEGVTTIGNSAFEDCRSLTSVTIPESVTSIDDFAFYSCDSLSTFYLLGSLTSIDDTIIPSRTKVICRLDTMGIALYKENHTFLASVSAPDFTVDIHFEADDSAWLEIIDYTGKDTEIIIPASIDNLPVLRVGVGSFRDCDSLTSVIIPEGVTSIGLSAFENCDSLSSIIIPEGVTSIDAYAFRNCDSLTSVIISEDVISIGYRAFEDCDSLTNVVIPNGVTSIGQEAFYSCDSLASLYLPDSLTYVADNFSSIVSYHTKLFCNLNTAGKLLGNGGYPVYSVSEPDFKVKVHTEADSSVWLELVGYTGTATEINIPASIDGLPVLWIGASAFKNNTSLRSVVIPEGVTTIGANAFNGCALLNSVTIPEGVTSINNYAFGNCSSLESLTLPDSLTTVDYSSFDYDLRIICDLYKTGLLLLDSGVYCSLISINEPDYVVYLNNDDSMPELFIIEYLGTSSKISIPGKIDDIAISYISNEAFMGCTTLTDVTISEGIASVYPHAFYGCTSLVNLTLPDGLEFIGEYAFSGCGALENLILPESMEYIARNAFQNCTAMTHIYLPKTLTTIKENVFGGCNTLTASGYCGTVAYTYCKEKGIPFKTLDVVSSVKFATANVEVMLGQEVQLKAKVTADTGEFENQLVTFTSSDEMIATVDPETGLLTAHAGGTVTITATSENGISATCKVKVISSNRIATINVNVNSDLTIRYYVEIDEENIGAKMRFTRNGKTTLVSGSYVSSGTHAGRYLFLYTGISPQYMADNIRAELIAADGTVLSVRDGISIRYYCENIYAASPGNSKLATLLADMLEYGAAAQSYTGYNTSDPANSPAWVAQHRTRFTPPAKTDQKVTVQAADTNKIRKVRLWLSNVNKICFSINVDAPEEYTVELKRAGVRVGNYRVSSLPVENGLYALYTDAITATGYGLVYTATMRNSAGVVVSEVEYSANSYIYSVYNAGGTLGRTVQALYNFGCSAEAFQ